MTTSTTTPKRPVGRPRKIDPRDAELAALRADIERLRATASQQGQGSPLPVPASTDGLPPGSYVTIGKDASGSPIQNKVRHTRASQAIEYKQTTFTPRRTLPVTINGVRYALTADEPFTGPIAVEDIYNEMLEGEKRERARYAPLTPQEKYDLDLRAAAAPGKHYSRLYRLGSVGLNVRDTEDVG